MNAEPGTMTTPRVRLVNAFERPSDQCTAAAMSCYSSKLVAADEFSDDELSRARRARIAERTFKAGHTTTREHAHFQFAIENASRFCIWAFLHDHPHYNSDQASQRYTAVNAKNVVVPRLSPRGAELYENAVRESFDAYAKLCDLLESPAAAAYADAFPSRAARSVNERARARFARDIRRRAQEVARYVIPIGAASHLHHTVSALVLHRYRRIAELSECPAEARALVDAMCAEVERIDPDFFAHDDPPIESNLVARSSEYAGRNGWLETMDLFLGTRGARLMNPSIDADIFTMTVRTVLGISDFPFTAADALAAVLSSARNRLLTDSLLPLAHDDLTRTLSTITLSYMKRISISADSQGQRHRVITRCAPRLERQFRFDTPDYVTPSLVAASDEARSVYADAMARAWRSIGDLLDAGEPMESALYLLPNAFRVRFIESGDLLGYLHKWRMRLCLNAQEEIRESSAEELADADEVLPGLADHVGPPCVFRDAAGLTPACPEAAGFCGRPVWLKKLYEAEAVV